jgi:transposase
MPAKNHLSQEQRERLLRTLKEHKNSYVREKIFILLLINDGKTYQDISIFLDIAYPTYSPDYNLIELVWHSAKEYIAHRLFESVEQLEELLNTLLNEGGLIIKWERKIKNEGNAVYSI